MRNQETWQVYSKFRPDGYMYIAGRRKDTSKPPTKINMEYRGGYVEGYETAKQLCDELNAEIHRAA